MCNDRRQGSENLQARHAREKEERTSHTKKKGGRKKRGESLGMGRRTKGNEDLAAKT